MTIDEVPDVVLDNIRASMKGVKDDPAPIPIDSLNVEELLEEYCYSYLGIRVSDFLDILSLTETSSSSLSSLSSYHKEK